MRLHTCESLLDKKYTVEKEGQGRERRKTNLFVLENAACKYETQKRPQHTDWDFNNIKKTFNGTFLG